MSDPCFVLLPGLDGTGDLFRPLIDEMPAGTDHAVVSYPPDRALSYAALLPVASAQIPRDRPVVLVGESFSGSLALRYAAAAGNAAHVRAVVLCATFLRSPIPRWLRHLSRPAAFRRPPPAVAVRTLLAGWRASPSLVAAVAAATARVRPDVMALRLREVIAVDARAALAACPSPVLYLRAARDRLVGPRAIRDVLAARPDVTVRTLDAPHLLLQTAPAAAWRAIAEFALASARCATPNA